MPSHYNQEGGSLTLSAFKIIANKNRRGVKGVRPLEEGELHYKNSNFMGPGTVYQKYKNWKPYNRPDAVAKVHDAEYDRIFNSKEMSKKEKAEAIRAADKKMIASLKALGKLEGEEEDYRQAGLKGIGFKKKLENVSQTLAKLLLGEWAGKKPEEEGQEGEDIMLRKEFEKKQPKPKTKTKKQIQPPPDDEPQPPVIEFDDDDDDFVPGQIDDDFVPGQVGGNMSIIDRIVMNNNRF